VPRALAATSERIPLPPAPQGEAIAFAGDGRLVVAGEGLPAAVSAVPVPAALAPATTAAPETGASAAAADAGGAHRGVPAVAAGVIAAVAAMFLVWIGGKLRRRRT
jgi:hypothetical protein